MLKIVLSNYTNSVHAFKPALNKLSFLMELVLLFCRERGFTLTIHRTIPYTAPVIIIITDLFIYLCMNSFIDYTVLPTVCQNSYNWFPLKPCIHCYTYRVEYFTTSRLIIIHSAAEHDQFHIDA